MQDNEQGKNSQQMRFPSCFRASDSQCRSRNCPGFDPSILLDAVESERAADEAVVNKVLKKSTKNPLLNELSKEKQQEYQEKEENKHKKYLSFLQKTAE